MSSGRGLSADPDDRMGVFKRLADVPDRYRFHHHANAYAGRDVWNEYLTECLFPEHPDATEKFYQTAETAGQRWKDHMADRGRHHALTTPEDVEAWCETLLERMTVDSVYSLYWVRLEGFYSWLQNHPDHPHVYHPVLMAAATSPGAQNIWERKLNRGNRRDSGQT